jgi:hypothetical protein
MAITYKLTRSTLDCSTFVDLTEAEYGEIVTAKRCLVILIGIEEKFDLLFANYAEYESTLLNLSLESLLGLGRDYSSFHDDRGLVNRRLLNLLSSTKAYLDQVKHDVGQLAGADAQVFLKELFSREYDTYLAYRAMEALRNYVQHRSLPVGSIGYPSNWIEHRTPRARRRHRVQVSLDTEALGDGDSFKPGVLRELRTPGNRYVPITPLVRQYIDCFGRVHGDLRKHVEATATEAERVIRVTHERAVAACGSDVGIVIRRELDDGRQREQHDIFLELLERRLEYVSKNATSLNLSRGYVSSETDSD